MKFFKEEQVGFTEYYNRYTNMDDPLKLGDRILTSDELDDIESILNEFTKIMEFNNTLELINENSNPGSVASIFMNLDKSIDRVVIFHLLDALSKVLYSDTIKLPNDISINYINILTDGLLDRLPESTHIDLNNYLENEFEKDWVNSININDHSVLYEYLTLDDLSVSKYFADNPGSISVYGHNLSLIGSDMVMRFIDLVKFKIFIDFITKSGALPKLNIDSLVKNLQWYVKLNYNDSKYIVDMYESFMLMLYTNIEHMNHIQELDSSNIIKPYLTMNEYDDLIKASNLNLKNDTLKYNLSYLNKPEFKGLSILPNIINSIQLIADLNPDTFYHSLEDNIVIIERIIEIQNSVDLLDYIKIGLTENQLTSIKSLLVDNLIQL